MTGDPLDTAPHSAASDNGALRVVMERLGAFAQAIAELKGLMISLDQRQQKAELDRVGAMAVLESKITSAHARLDVHNEKLVEQRADINELDRKHEAARRETDRQLNQFATAYRIMAFIGGGLGLTLIAFIWTLITGQAKVTFGP